MDFKLGADLGVILAKGIVFSFLSVMTFLPALTLCCYKLLDKTRHRKLMPSFGQVGKFLPKIRVPALVAVLAVIVPCYLAQGRTEFIYGFADLTKSGRVGRDTAMIDSEFGALNPLVLLAPRGSAEREARLVQLCGELPHVRRVISYTGAVGREIPEEFLGDEVTSRFFSPGYSRIILYTDAEPEGDETFELVERLREASRMIYGYGSGGDVHVIGTSATLYDMKDVVTRDNSVVNAIAIISILGVLIVTFRSVALPVILLMTIEAAIWFNVSIAYFTATPLCYIGYLIINTVQLGATVDYAILFTDHYRSARRVMSKFGAVRSAFDAAFTSILVSGLVLSLAGFTLGLTSTNPIVSDMGILLGRGTIFSALLAVCFLPAALIVLDKAIVRTTWKMRVEQESQMEENK
jgi:predicted RND superfamily exporter protein